MAWCHQATSHYLGQCWPICNCHMVPQGHNKLKDIVVQEQTMPFVTITLIANHSLILLQWCFRRCSFEFNCNVSICDEQHWQFNIFTASWFGFHYWRYHETTAMWSCCDVTSHWLKLPTIMSELRHHYNILIRITMFFNNLETATLWTCCGDVSLHSHSDISYECKCYWWAALFDISTT